MKRINRIPLALAALLAAALACNLPQATPAVSEPNAAFTAAALTVAAQLTQSALTLNAPTVTSIAPPLTTPPTNTTTAPTIAPPPTISPTLSPTATQICDKAQFIKDITIPDGTVKAPGEAFEKIWQLKNIGACSWTGYSLVFDDGNPMSGPASSAIGNTPPGGTVDISVNLVAPATTGVHRGYWRIRNSSGYLLPVVSGYQNKSFYVDIKVQFAASVGFDLHSQASSAQWISCGSPCGGGTILSFGGPDTDTNGFVLYRNGAKLEDGSTPAKVLETHPMWVDDGVISGLYPAYAVQPGEHFRAKIGFLAKADDTCGVGNATFQLNYKESGTIHPLGSWTDSCNGNLLSIDVDLSGISGHTVQFALVVMANGTASQDWAVWVNPNVIVP